jgi:hypothetical protein
MKGGGASKRSSERAGGRQAAGPHGSFAKVESEPHRSLLLFFFLPHSTLLCHTRVDDQEEGGMLLLLPLGE